VVDITYNRLVVSVLLTLDCESGIKPVLGIIKIEVL